MRFKIHVPSQLLLLVQFIVSILKICNHVICTSFVEFLVLFNWRQCVTGWLCQDDEYGDDIDFHTSNLRSKHMEAKQANKSTVVITNPLGFS
jgi:hypothetical protein